MKGAQSTCIKVPDGAGHHGVPITALGQHDSDVTSRLGAVGRHALPALMDLRQLQNTILHLSARIVEVVSSFTMIWAMQV